MTKSIHQLIHFLFSKNLARIELALLTVFVSMIYFNNFGSIELQPDETFWISSTMRLDKLLAGDFRSPYWAEDEYTSYEVRPISSYLAGIGQKLGGIKDKNLPLYWSWQLSEEDNISRGALPSEKVLYWSRLPMVVISIFSMAGIILLLAGAHSRAAAYAFALLSFNEYFLTQLRRTLSEPPQIFFTVLALCASYKLLTTVQKDSTKKIVLWSVIAGIFSGLAGQSKLTGLACAAIPIVGLMILIADPSKSAELTKRRIPLIVTFVVLASTFLAFIASYPLFYANTFDGIMLTLATRRQIIQYQVVQYAYQAIQPGDRLSTLFERIFKYPIDFALNPIMVALLHWANFLLTVWGIIYSVKQVWMKNKDWEYFAVFLLGAFVCAVPMLFTPLDWERYYLYPIFFSCIFFCIGAGELFFILLSRLQKQKAAKVNAQELLQD